MTHHLGYEHDDPAGAGSGDSRNGSATRTVSTTNGPVTLTVPRDRNGSLRRTNHWRVSVNPVGPCLLPDGVGP
jgi:transposase-like protein